MEIDTVKKKTTLPGICYRCGDPGHRRPDCPCHFDIHLMSMEECEDWMQEKVLEQDTEEIMQRDNETGNREKESAVVSVKTHTQTAQELTFFMLAWLFVGG
jgi:hypothetical protein